MKALELRVPCSPDQIDVITDHFLYDHELGMQPDERAWIISHVKKQHPTARVISAALDLTEGEWIVSAEVKS